MTAENYEKRMKQHEATFERLRIKIVNDTNTYIDANPEKTMYSLNRVDKFSDNICLSGAWIKDRIDGYSNVDEETYTSKIRKALGFTYLQL